MTTNKEVKLTDKLGSLNFSLANETAGDFKDFLKETSEVESITVTIETGKTIVYTLVLQMKESKKCYTVRVSYDSQADVTKLEASHIGIGAQNLYDIICVSFLGHGLDGEEQ